jgi:hypothetical protein
VSCIEIRSATMYYITVFYKTKTKKQINTNGVVWRSGDSALFVHFLLVSGTAGSGGEGGGGGGGVGAGAMRTSFNTFTLFTRKPRAIE